MKKYTVYLPPQLPVDIVNQIAQIDEFKGKWDALKNITPDSLSRFYKVASIASIGSSTRIEGAQLSDVQGDELLSHIDQKSFPSCDEQETILAIEKLPPASEEIIQLINQRKKITISDIVILLHINRNTAKKHLKELSYKNLIQKNGAGKGTWYSPL